MIRYREIRVNGWLNFQYVCGEEMTADEAINNVPGAKPEDCWSPTEVTKNEYDLFAY